MNSNEQRYTAVAIVLHWAIAAAILSNLIVGCWMKVAIDEAAAQARAIAAFQLHKSIGLTVLLLTALRLLWRFTHKSPPLPAGMARWECVAAKATHCALYILMVLVALGLDLRLLAMGRWQAAERADAVVRLVPGAAPVRCARHDGCGSSRCFTA